MTSFKSALKPIVGTCLAIAALSCMALTNQTPVNPGKPVAATTQLEVVKQGKQPIKTGCANIYGSDPDQVFIDPDTGLRVLTAVFTICDDRSLNGVALSALGFDRHDDIDIGLTYVETGPGCWLTLYDGENFSGKTAVISPQTSMHLKHVGARNWNDITRSLAGLDACTRDLVLDRRRRNNQQHVPVKTYRLHLPSQSSCTIIAFLDPLKSCI